MKKLILSLMLLIGIHCQAQSDSTAVKRINEVVVKITHNQISIFSDTTSVIVDIKVSDQKGTDTYYRCSTQEGTSISISIIKTATRPLCIVTENDFSKIYVVRNKLE